MFKTRQSKYTFVAVDIVYLLFLGWHIITLLSSKVTPLTTPRGSAMIIIVGVILLFLETFIEGTKTIKQRFRGAESTMTWIQTLIIVVLSIYSLYLGFGVETLSQTLRNVSLGLLILLFVFLTKELLFDIKGN